MIPESRQVIVIKEGAFFSIHSTKHNYVTIGLYLKALFILNPNVNLVALNLRGSETL